MTTAPGSVTLPSAKTFVAKRLDAIRQTINSTAISMKTTDTFLFMFLFFKWFPRIHYIFIGTLSQTLSLRAAFASSTYLLSQIPGLGRSSDDDFVLSLSN